MNEILEKSSLVEMIKVDYVLIHNIIYRANAFAEDNGFKISKDFGTTQFILKEYTEEVELMEIEFGKNGKPFILS